MHRSRVTYLFAGMKIPALVCALLMAAPVALPQSAVPGEELAVWRATVAEIARQNASKPFKQLYFMSNFDSVPQITSSMSDPARTDLCGLSRPDAESMLGKLVGMSAEAIELDQSIGQESELKLGKRKDYRLKYVSLSRVVFDEVSQRAWVAVDLSDTTGSIMRLDKVNGAWSWVSSCAPWRKSR